MARKPVDAKPLFPIKHDFVASLDRFIHEAGMLRDAVRQAIQLDAVKKGPITDILQERLKAFDLARFGEDGGDA